MNLRDENKLTQSTTETVLANVTTLCSHLVDDIQKTIGERLNNCQVSSNTVAKVLETLNEDDFRQPFKGIETKHQQLTYLQQHLGYVVRMNKEITIYMHALTHVYTHAHAHARAHTYTHTHTHTHTHTNRKFQRLRFLKFVS